MSADFDRRDQRKARKRHMCHLCYKLIRPGAEYIYHTQRYSGEIRVFKRHIHCDAVMGAVLDMYFRDELEITEDEIAETIRDKICHSCEKYENFDCLGHDCYACEIVQKTFLEHVMLNAAIQSVKDNEVQA